MKRIYFILILLIVVFRGLLFAGNNELLDIYKNQNGFYFIENKGQWNDEVKFLFKSTGYYAWITSFGVVYDYFDFEDINSSNVVKMRLNGINDDIYFVAKRKRNVLQFFSWK